jgi:hypothetical protein
MIYVYFFKQDVTQEVIGNVKANSLQEAQEKIAIKKQLPANEIDRLFVIKQKKEESCNQSSIKFL